MNDVVSWEKLKEWQDAIVKTARENMLEDGTTPGQILFLAGGPVPEQFKDTASYHRPPEKAEDGYIVCLPRNDTPENVAGLLVACSPEFARVHSKGRLMGMDESEIAETLVRVASQRYGLDLRGLLWFGAKKLGKMLNASAAINISEAYMAPPGTKLAPGQAVSDRPDREEVVIVVLDSRVKTRVVVFKVHRQNPKDEKSKVVSLSEVIADEQGQGRMGDLIEKAC